jgi:hypothetical protein
MSDPKNYQMPITGTKKTGLSGFLQQLAAYYSQFLETDFKAIREPKRKYNEKRDGQRVGIHLSHYPKFRAQLINCLNQSTPITLKIAYGAYTATLAKSVITGISSAIQSVENTQLNSEFEAIHQRCKNSPIEEIDDYEIFVEEIILAINLSIKQHIVDRVINLLTPLLTRQSGSAAAALNIDSYANELVEALTTEYASAVVESIGTCIYQQQSDDLRDVFNSISNLERLQSKLHSYFESFAARDLFIELRSLLGTHGLIENSQIYLNIGEINFNQSKFPIYYVPIELAIERNIITLEIGSSIYANKKLIDYLLGQLNKNHQLTATNPLTDRIFHKTPEQSYFDVILESFHKILAAINVEGEINLQNAGASKSEKFAMLTSNDMSLSLFDKSDESIVNDYEALMVGLDDNHPLVQAFKQLIDAFLTTNPLSVEPAIEQQWDDTPTTDRLVFKSPLPLAEEQRKVLNALRHPDAKFVIVEGPPGTGKSHTISAIALNDIRVI